MPPKLKKKDRLSLTLLNDESIPRKRHVKNMPPGLLGCNWTSYKKEMKARQALALVKEDLKVSRQHIKATPKG